MMVGSTPSAPGRVLRANSGHLLVGDGQHHAFLGFGDPDFGIGEALVLERGSIEPHFCANFLTHLADGTAKSTCPTIGDCRIEFSIAGSQQHVEYFLFLNGIADLDGSARELFTLAGQLGTGEGSAVNSVATRPPTNSHNQIIRLWLFVGFVLRYQAYISTINKGIPR